MSSTAFPPTVTRRCPFGDVTQEVLIDNPRPLVVVDGELADHERLGRLASPERRPDPGDQLGGREGLDDVVGRARIERLGDGLFAAVGGDEDDRHVGELGDLPHQLDAVGVGQHQVEQHEPRPLGPG
ncbi:MAG: hypothetical protein OXF93_18360 [Acidobacteria bacterium]|nr:hypothetical protein [Acidobacteriota bacterium]